MVVSFHESNLNGSFTRGHKNFSDKPCAVIVDKVTEVSLGYGVDYTIQRGFIRYSVHSATKYYKNGIALVKYDDINSMFNDNINLLFGQLRDTYLDMNPDNDVPVVWKRLDINELSFMSVGLSIVNSICLLIDLYAYYTDNKRRSILVEITNNIVSEIPDDRLTEIKIALEDRFEGTDNKLYKLLIEG